MVFILILLFSIIGLFQMENVLTISLKKTLLRFQNTIKMSIYEYISITSFKILNNKIQTSLVEKINRR